MDDDKTIAYETNKPIEYVHVSKKEEKNIKKRKTNGKTTPGNDKF